MGCVAVAILEKTDGKPRVNTQVLHAWERTVKAAQTGRCSRAVFLQAHDGCS